VFTLCEQLTHSVGGANCCINSVFPHGGEPGAE
jgi:hypothetical protein